MWVAVVLSGAQQRPNSVIPTGALRLDSPIAMRSGGTCWLDPPTHRPDVRRREVPDRCFAIDGDSEEIRLFSEGIIPNEFEEEAPWLNCS